MPKAENRKMLPIYSAAIAIFSTTVGIISMGVMVTYATNDQNEIDFSPQNGACYNAGLADGQKNSLYNQSMVKQCGVNGHAYYQGFVAGCITGQGKDFFSCQSLTNAPIGSDSGGSGNAGGDSGNTNYGG
ncbi:MAG TPA: hypothetical protein VJ729_07310 [Nitrososphaeraceae archaeon]|jgi:hypothetical protein|nr:hypothetical protein [Nitrososphaeraceae archaeon]